MDRKRGWFSILLGTVWVGAVLWALTYKVCLDYTTLGLQGSIVIAVAALLLWILAFRLLDYMLHTETVRNLKILIMSFICGIVFALYFPLLMAWINPNFTHRADSEAVPESHISVPIWNAKTTLPSATTTMPTIPTTPPVATPPPATPSSPTPATPLVTSPPVTERKPAPVPPKPEVEKEGEPRPVAPRDETKAEEIAPKPAEEKENP